MNIQELQRERESKFIETRTKIEMEVNMFFKSIESIDDERVTAIPGKPAGTTCKEVLPSLWVEPFNETVYSSELKALLTYVAAVKNCCDAINEEALRCLQSQ